ncbi:PE domain-containing protein, partial [Mycobacterium tuberculosis]|uniref:PE domain-containing protein n=1 Tax=Mycobacterium tuberculosis TaxID=1773 RepID=UPI0020748B40
RSSGGYLLDEPPDMTPSFPRTGVSGHAGAVQQAARGTAFHRKLVRTLANGALAYEEVEIANNEGF